MYFIAENHQINVTQRSTDDSGLGSYWTSGYGYFPPNVNVTTAVDSRSLSVVLTPPQFIHGTGNNSTPFPNGSVALLCYENPTGNVTALLEYYNNPTGEDASLEWVDISSQEQNHYQLDTSMIPDQMVVTHCMSQCLDSHSVLPLTEMAPMGDPFFLVF